MLLDLPGFGLSVKPDLRYSIRLYADAVEAVMDATGIASVAMVTHDMGDTVGGELLARDIEGSLPFAISERVLTNGSIYIDMAQLTNGQHSLSAVSELWLNSVSPVLRSTTRMRPSRRGVSTVTRRGTIASRSPPEMSRPS